MTARLLPFRPGALLRSVACSGGLAALLAMTACDSGGELLGPDDLDFVQLLAQPTDDELQAIEDGWETRSNPVRDALIVDSASTDTTAALYVVSHTQTEGDGSLFTHYGLVRIPEGAAAFPVVVFHHGDGFAVSDVLSEIALFPDLAAATVQVVPVYRSETLTADTLLSRSFTAGGDPSPWDRDVDDAIGLVDAALQLFPDAMDGTRIAALGHGRGGNTALLHAVRDDRLLAVAEFAGPVDFVNPTMSEILGAVIGGEPDTLAFPSADFLADALLRPLLDGTLSYDEARLALIRRSPGFFAARLPGTRANHHEDDPVVPNDLARWFEAHAEEDAPEEFDVDANVDDDLPEGVSSYHDIRAMASTFTRTERFLEESLSLNAPPP